MYATNPHEEEKLDAMQRIWQGRRGHSASLLEEIPHDEGMLARQTSQPPTPKACETPPPGPFFDEPIYAPTSTDLEEEDEGVVTLDAANIGDFPAIYRITRPRSHQMPAIGVYVDRRIVPGFRYRVWPLPAPGDKKAPSPLFDGKALTLTGVGRGYARRFTFEGDGNYFYSDNRPEGYGFELALIAEGDKFTIYDGNREAQGTLEIVKIDTPQREIGHRCTPNKGVEKRADVRFTGKVEFYETGVAKPMPLTGVAIATKRGNRAELVKVINVAIRRQRYTLVPGIHTCNRRVTVRGQDINDVPTKYTINGLEPYEIPVVGTYVDPRIVPGFHYRVRPNDRKEHLFGGRALKLISIGMGYAKRLTFEPDSLLEPNNYLWSDNHPDGLGLEPRAVRKDMKFVVTTSRGQVLGEATVFRADRPQIEERMEMVKTNAGYAVQKYIHVDVTCHLRFELPGGGTSDEHMMRVYGLAVVRKEPKAGQAHVARVENVGLDSQLNILFAQNHAELIFYPKN